MIKDKKSSYTKQFEPYVFRPHGYSIFYLTTISELFPKEGRYQIYHSAFRVELSSFLIAIMGELSFTRGEIFCVFFISNWISTLVLFMRYLIPILSKALFTFYYQRKAPWTSNSS